MRTDRHRVAPAAPGVVLLLAMAVSACGSDAPALPSSGGDGPAGSALPPAATASIPVDAPAATPSAMFGSFRRGAIPVPPDVLRDAEVLCRTKPVPPYAEEIGSRPLVVSDLRGLGVLVLVFADATGATGCRIEADLAGGMRATHFAVKAGPEGPLEPGGLTLGAIEYVQDGTSQRTIAVGRAGERAVHVRAGFDDDTYVTAALDNGWYAMWWPGSIRPAVIVAGDNRNVAMGKLTPP